MQHIIETVDSNVWFGENIIYVLMEDGAIVDLEAARSHIKKWNDYLDAHNEIKQFALIVNMKGLKTITREARICYAERSDPRGKAVALIAGSPVTRIIANFIMSFTRPEKPIHLFSTPETALNRVKNYLQT